MPLKNTLTSLFIVIIFLSGCTDKQAPTDESIEGFQLKDSISFQKGLLQLIDSLQTHDIRDTAFFLETAPLPIGCVNPPTRREDLTSLKTVIKIFNGETNAGISVPGFGGISLGKSEINYNVYYIEPKLVNCGQDTAVFGCGYSLHLLVKKLKRGLDLSKIPSIAASVQLENRKTSVYYSLETHGLAGTVLVKFFKPVVNKPFDVEGFGIMQSSIDGIHNILGDDSLSKKVRFTPVQVKFVKPSDLEQ